MEPTRHTTPASASPTLAADIAALRPLLVRVARQRLRNDAWAEDAVSETLLAAFERPAAFEGRAQLSTWLVGILKHKLVDQVRRHMRERQLDGSDDGGGGDAATDLADELVSDWGDPQQQLARREFMAELDRALAALPPRQVRAFVLRNCVGADTESICRELGVSANNLGVMLHRARNRLRDALRSHWALGALAHQG
jgi:RNA polymerase sigma-70 factor (ECF subfamily)